MFNAVILDISDGSQVAGTSKPYTTIEDGISLMKEIAEQLLKKTTDEAWKTKWLYAGARVGFSPRNYIINTNEDISAKNYISYEAALLGEVNIFKLFAVQTELIFSGDKIFIGSEFGDITVAANTLQIPLLAKLTFRPRRFYFAGFAGPYIALPLGKMELTKNDVSGKYDFSSTVGLTGGADAGIKLGGGILFLDARYSGDFLFFRADDAAQYRRKIFSISLGYSYGFFDKK
jgi:hypothetical protein